MTSSLPLLIYGTITESATGVNAITVKIRNETTNEVGTATTDSNGLYLIDLSNAEYFPSGWADGQKVTVYTIYSNFEGEETLTIALPAYGYEQSIALTAVTDSDLVDYCVVQDVYDELDDKTASDISAERVVKAIQRAEGWIDVKTNTSFKSVTVTDEVHTADRYNLDLSPDFLDTVASTSTLRRDAWGAVLNRVQTDFAPIISVTSLSTNGAGFNSADDWTELTEQEGSSGDFIVEEADTGTIDFLNSYPRIGKRSWKITYAYGYDRTSTNRRVVTLLRIVTRLTVLLAVKNIVNSKITGNAFDSGRSVTISKVSISSGSISGSSYLNSIQREIDALWEDIGGMGIEVI